MMYQKEFNPPENLNMAIYDVRIWYKEHITDVDYKSIGGYQASKYRYDIIPGRREDGMFAPVKFDNERVEGFGFNVFIDVDGFLTILDMDNGASYVIDMHDVLTFQTRTCKRVLPETQNNRQNEDKAIQYCIKDGIVTKQLAEEEYNET